MPEMILYGRAATIPTTSGHTVAFARDTVTFVPPTAVSACIARGAVLYEQPSETVEETNEDGTPVPVLVSADERTAAILKACRAIRAGNKASDFTASGRPKAAAVQPMVGYTVSTNEIAAAWDTLEEEQRIADGVVVDAPAIPTDVEE